MRRTVGLASCLLGIGIVAGCTSDPEPAPDAQPSASATVTDQPPASTQAPLAIIVHPSRGALDVSKATAKKVETGATTNWSAFGAQPARATVITSGGAAARVRAVARDPDAIAAVSAHRVDPRVRTVLVDGVDPLTDPENYSLTTAGNPAPDPVTVTVVGDIMLARGVAEANGADAWPALRPTAARLASPDLTVGNLESALSQDGDPIQGTDSFGADPAVLGSLQRAGFDVLSLANNHVGDFGEVALEQTLRRMDRSRIERVGAGFDLPDASKPTIVEVGGTRIGFVAFNSIGEAPPATADSPGVVQLRMPPRTGPLNRDDLNAVLKQIRAVKQRVDTVFVIPHWGDQYMSRPSELQRRIARQLADAGATAVLGGHPHWVQGMEMAGDTLVAYSLGNFIFDMDFSEPTMQGITLDLTLWDGRLMSATPVAVQLNPSFVARFVGGVREDQILDDVWSNSYGSFRP